MLQNLVLILLINLIFCLPALAQAAGQGARPQTQPGAGTPPAQTPRDAKQSQDVKPDVKEKDAKEDDSEIKLGADLVAFNVAVTDAQGRRITNLKPSDIVVYEDGVPQQLAFFNTTEEPFRVVLLLDVSGSAQSQLATIQQAARQFLDQLREGDQVAIISFAESPTLEVDFTSKRAQLERAINRLAVPLPHLAGTSFYDALRIMVEHVLDNASGRKAFVAITDGLDSTSTASYRQILPLLTRSGATGYFIQVDTEEPTLARVMKSRIEEGAVRFTAQQLRKYLSSTPQIADTSRYDDSYKLSPLERREVNSKLYELARAELKELAAKSGGHVYPIEDLEEAPEALKQVADEIRLQYSVGYYPKVIKRDGRWHELRVEVKRPGALVHARPGYTAPKD